MTCSPTSRCSPEWEDSTSPSNDGLLPTPTANDSRGGRNRTSSRKANSQRHDGLTLSDVWHKSRTTPPAPESSNAGGPMSRDGEMLLRTPQAGTPNSHRGVPQSASQRAAAGHAVSVGEQITDLLPTPKAQEAAWTPTEEHRPGHRAYNEKGYHKTWGVQQVVDVLLPTPQTSYTATTTQEWRARRPAGNGATRETVGDLRLVIEHELTSSSEGSPASPSATPASARAPQTTVGSGPSSPVLLASLGPDSCSSRTSLASDRFAPTLRLPLTDAYAAGLIDGEGCIGIAVNSRRTSPTYGARVEVGMSEKAKPLLDEMCQHYGGTVRPTRKASERWEAAWTWGLFGRSTVDFIVRVLPHLILKRQQAEMVLRLYAMVDDLPHTADGKPRWTEEARSEAACMRGLVMGWNQKGPSVTREAGWFARYVGGRWLTDQSSMLSPTGWERFSGPWPTSGMTRCGQAFALPTSVPVTAVSESSSLRNVPTPTASDHIERRSTNTGGPSKGELNYETGKSVSLDRWASHDWSLLPTRVNLSWDRATQATGDGGASRLRDVAGLLGDLTKPPSGDGSK